MLGEESTPDRHLFNRYKRPKGTSKVGKTARKKGGLSSKENSVASGLEKAPSRKAKSKEALENQQQDCEGWLHILCHPKRAGVLTQPVLCSLQPLC